MFRILLKALLGLLMRVLFRPRVEGAGNIPESGPVILAGNHVTFIDSIFLSLVVKRQVFFIGKDEYVTGRGLKGRLMAWFFTTVGMVPVDRDGAHGGVAALATGQRLLEEGKVFGIYPEGTRSPDGRLYRGRTGVARLALTTGHLLDEVAWAGFGLQFGEDLAGALVHRGIVENAERANTLAQFAAEVDIRRRGQVVAQSEVLVDDLDAVLPRLDGLVQDQFLAVHLHGAMAGAEIAGDHLDQRRLAGAIVAHQADHLAGLDRQRHVVDREQPAKTTNDVLCSEHGGANSHLAG